MRYLIGIDSGGSKTETILFDETGRVLVRDLDLGASAMDIGKEAAQERIETILRRVMPRSPEQVCEVFGGIVSISLGDFMYRHLRKVLPPEVAVQVEGDGGILMSGMIGHRDGCSMISGTGGAMFVRHGDAPLTKVGGRGFLIDAYGSGYGLGRDALCAAYRSFDGRGPSTVLHELVDEQLGKSIGDAMMDIYDQETGGRAFIAKFAGLIMKAREMGDAVAIESFERHTDSLADMTYAAERFFEGSFPVVMNGGIFNAFPEYRRAVMDKASPRAEMIMSTVPPVYGAVVEAMWNAGIPMCDGFRETFMETYLQAKAKG